MSTDTRVPYDFDSACTTAEWREQLRWPVVNEDLRPALHAQSCRYLSLVEECVRDEARNVLLLSAWVLGRIRALTIGAYTCDAARKKDMQFRSVYPEIQWFTGQVEFADIRAFESSQNFTVQQPRWAPIRRAARIRSWTRLCEVPHALLWPAVTAVSHNSVLRSAARCADRRVGFVHAETMLARGGRASEEPRDTGAISALAEVLTAALADPENHPDLDHDLARKLEALVRPACYAAVTKSLETLNGLGCIERMPESIWSGTGGNYSARAVGLEVLRRGGEVTRFSHAGASGLLDNPAMDAIVEMAVSSRFVTATKELADNVLDSGGAELTKEFRTVQIDAHLGDPSFRQVPRGCMRRGHRPRVVYATTVLSGMRQYAPPLLPDLVYLDWQIRLLEMLQDLPVELIFKPHPGGLLKGREHPLNKVAYTCSKPFETLLGQASMFVLDYPGTTAFWKALCSDSIVVWIDLGQVALNESIRNFVHCRCRVIPATYGSDGKPVIQPEALEQALFTERRDCERPETFRKILGGEDN